MSIYYRMILAPDQCGLAVVTEKWVSVHESPCFSYCVDSNRMFWVERNSEREGISRMQAAKNLKALKRISKENSRFAFRDKNKALNNLRFLKKRQLIHLERQTKFIEKFLACDELEIVSLDGLMHVPGSEELVREYYHFE